MRFETLRDNEIVNLRLRGEASEPARVVNRVLSTLDTAGPLRPDDAVVDGRRCPFDVATITERVMTSLSEATGKLVGAGATLIRRREPELDYNVHVRREGSPSVDGDFLRSTFDAPAASEAFIALVRELATHVAAAYGRVHDMTDLSLATKAHPESHRPPDSLDEVYWLNVWGPTLVERYGRDRVLGAPAFRVEELSYGGVLVVTRATPADLTSAKAREAQASILAHVRPDLDKQAILATLMERSRILAPVEHDFDADVAELLELTLHSIPRAARPREAERLNGYHPPSVTELRSPPLAAAGNAEALVERYGDEAEKLVALLRKSIPDIEGGDPAVLPRIDHHLWHFKFAEDFERKDIENDLVPAVGAYLGQMMVDRLGGQWVPRKKLDESQVVVGDTAYLPFLRARHALASRQAQLDHSLTQFFRVAARRARGA